MSRSAGVFYAYVQAAGASIDTAPVIVVFPNRRIADDWWRVVDQSNDYRSNDEKNVTIERTSSQVYLASSGSDFRQNLSLRLTKLNQEHRFGIMLFDAIRPNDPLGGAFIIPPDPFRDLVTGESYFIRSAADPSEYWHISGDEVHVSKTKRTPFRISMKNAQRGNEIMVQSDLVSIEDSFRPRGLELKRVDNRMLYLSVTPDGEKGNFFELHELLYYSRFTRDENGRIQRLSIGQRGEPWELV